MSSIFLETMSDPPSEQMPPLLRARFAGDSRFAIAKSMVADTVGLRGLKI
jgi:hypothetical protein